MQKSITLLLVAALAGTSVLGTTEPSRSQSNMKVEILLVSYAVTKAAYDRIILSDVNYLGRLRIGEK